MVPITRGLRPVVGTRDRERTESDQDHDQTDRALHAGSLPLGGSHAGDPAEAYGTPESSSPRPTANVGQDGSHTGGHTNVDTMGFDLDRFVRTSGRVDLSEVAWERARDVPLERDEVRLLRYMMDIETHTVIFLRDLLATRAAFDPAITAFLSCWNYEEYWHGEAFSRLLGEAGSDRRPIARRSRTTLRTLPARSGSVGSAGTSAPAGT